MTDKVEIFNLALSRIGTATTVADPDELSAEATQLRVVYDTARRTTLRSYPWNFATKRVALADLDAPLDGWDFAYALPSDCLKPRRLFNEADPKGEEEPIAFEIALASDSNNNDVKVLLTDQPEAMLIYTANIENPNLFDSEFVYILSWILGSEVAMPLTGDVAKRNACLTSLQQAMPSARASNATEGTNPKQSEASWILGR